ncbi:ABC transporter transmembrane domain-containing protein [Rubellimicrobium sp. CFH 75288]|uniref:ABC transporter transmembrane domain-containing protein n=1 Tax=Rubellimicrobium sp. CFH 75288 TaxID=2697034 RepID=UPI001412824E|nr:ABC transporter transmembrane domain-containing protein [Rubellimicrobium sp. CFH 75288]NAZ35318.1 ATP-binding cassette domain-containing protein [Rubellimicrobium sp. CFH 75288]
MAQTSSPALPASPAASPDRAPSRRVAALAALWPFVRPYRTTAVLALIALVLTAAVSLVLPLAVRRVVDNFGAAEVLLDRYFAGALVIVGLLAVGTALRYYLVTRLGERVVADIRRAVFDRMIGMSPAVFERLMTGEVLSRITTDTTLILSVLGSSISVALRNALIFLGGMVLLIATSAKLTGLVLLLVPAVIVPIVILGRRVRRLSRENQDWIAASSGAASETLLAAPTVQAFTAEQATRDRFADLTERSFDSARRRIAVRAVMTAIVIFLIFSGVVGVLWVGARDVASGSMTIGQLVQFVIYAIMVAGAVGSLTEVWGEVQRAAGATERLLELLALEDSVRDPDRPRPAPSPSAVEVRLEGVTFRYPSRPDQAALHGVDLVVRPGETVALVGPSGSGKSTVIQLLQRFWDPQEGRITLGGVDLRDMQREDLRRQIALVPQEPVIFADTARANIRFGRPDATDEEVETAARAAAAHDFLSALPQGYDTYVGERGVMLSGGQKQRIAIARAILRDAPLLLLDEATSALDAESERAVQQAVDQLARTRTTLIVAHRLATVKRADRIVVMEGGRIVAEGTHDALVAQGGLYARLARLQFTEGLAAE